MKSNTQSGLPIERMHWAGKMREKAAPRKNACHISKKSGQTCGHLACGRRYRNRAWRSWRQEGLSLQNICRAVRVTGNASLLTAFTELMKKGGRAALSHFELSLPRQRQSGFSFALGKEAWCRVEAEEERSHRAPRWRCG